MFRKKGSESDNGHMPELVQPIDVSVYAMSKGADRMRALEKELEETFTEWALAQRALADESLVADFKFSPALAAAWAAWKVKAGIDNAIDQTTEIPLPVGWPGEASK